MLLVWALGLSCRESAAAEEWRGEIRVAGSTLLMPVMREAADQFSRAHPKVSFVFQPCILVRRTRHPALGALWGVLCGTVTQSGTSTRFLLVGFVSSGIIPLASAMHIVAWAIFTHPQWKLAHIAMERAREQAELDKAA